MTFDELFLEMKYQSKHWSDEEIIESILSWLKTDAGKQTTRQQLDTLLSNFDKYDNKSGIICVWLKTDAGKQTTRQQLDTLLSNFENDYEKSGIIRGWLKTDAGKQTTRQQLDTLLSNFDKDDHKSHIILGWLNTDLGKQKSLEKLCESLNNLQYDYKKSSTIKQWLRTEEGKQTTPEQLVTLFNNAQISYRETVDIIVDWLKTDVGKQTRPEQIGALIKNLYDNQAHIIREWSEIGAGKIVCETTNIANLAEKLGVPQEKILLSFGIAKRDVNLPGIVDMYNNYATLLLAPKVFDHLVKSNISPDIDLNKILENYIIPSAINALTGPMTKSQLEQLSEHWHEPLQQSEFQKLRDFGGKSWTPLIENQEVPEEIAGEKGWSIKVRNSSATLIKEGKELEHCVGGYTRQCAYGKSHIASIVAPDGKPMSTIEYQAQYPYQKLATGQHYGRKNQAPDRTSIAIKEWLDKEIQSGNIPVDYKGLERDMNQRINAPKTLAEKAADLCEIDVTDQAKREKVNTVYRKHTPDYAMAGFHALVTMPSIIIKIDGQKHEVILNKKEYAKELKTQRWKGKAGQSAGPANKKADKTWEALQEKCDAIFEEKISVSKYEDGTRFGQIMITPNPESGLTYKEISEKLGDIMKDRPKKFELQTENNSVIIKNMTPAAVLSLIGGGKQR